MNAVKAIIEFLVDFKRNDDWIFGIYTLNIFRTCVSGVLENMQTVYNADGVTIEFGLNDEQWQELELRLPNGYKIFSNGYGIQ